MRGALLPFSVGRKAVLVSAFRLLGAQGLLEILSDTTTRERADEGTSVRKADV